MSWHYTSARALLEHTSHQARWQELHLASGANPVLALELASASLSHFGSGGELLAWYQRDGATTIMAILTPARLGGWNTFQPAQAPVGLWLQRTSVLEHEVLAALLAALPGAGLMLGLTQCDPLLLARPVASDALHTVDYIETARVSVCGSFEAYWNGRGKNLRTNLRKQRRHLAEQGIATRLDTCRLPQQMAEAVADYARLESAGWKAKDGTAVTADNAQGRFYRQLLQSLAQRDAACVYRYWIGEQLAAMDLCIEGGDCLVVLKTAYAEDLGAHLSPALLMREETTRAIFDAQRHARIEFYGRVMEWHLRWSNEIRTLYHLNLYRWPWLGRLRQRLRR